MAIERAYSMSDKIVNFCLGALAFVITAAPTIVFAESTSEPIDSSARESAIEEVVVTARRRAESLQDVPVTASVLSADLMERQAIDTMDEMANRIPNFVIIKGASGGGGSLRLRGIGTSNISAAFDSAIALNIDGVVTNSMRMVNNTFMDLEQVELLKGPQSLYYGKSASAGVLTMRSNDPGSEFEADMSVSYESELDTTTVFGVISGPLSDTLGMRLALQSKETDELFKNTAPGVRNSKRGEESFDARLTTVWEPSDALDARLKLAYSDFENDGTLSNHDMLCPGTQQDVIVGGVVYGPSGLDCDPFDREVQFGDANPILRGNYLGWDGVPFSDQEATFASLQVAYDLSDTLTLNSTTGYFDIDDESVDAYAGNQFGLGIGLAQTKREGISQEVRLESSYDGPVNFMAGLYYQDREINFESGDVAPLFLQFFGPNPGTGETFEWHKVHDTDAETWSAFFSLDWNVTDRLDLTAGVRYTDEEVSNTLELPYVYFLLPVAIPVAGSSGFQSSPIEFEDDNVSPELSLRFAATDSTMIYAAYKTGFKSGGVDNSALPTNVSAPALQGLIYDSETSDGFEVGTRSDLLDGTLRINSTFYRYVYEDLQVQIFNGATFQYVTQNFGEVTSQGAELDLIWVVADGLALNASLYYSDSELTDDIFDQTNVNQKGEQITGNAEWTAQLGLDYSWPVGDNLRAEFSLHTRYSDDYNLANESQVWYRQDSYWVVDAYAALESADEGWRLSITGINVFDEDYALEAGASTGRIPNVEDNGRFDQRLTIAPGRLFTFEAKYRF